MQLCDVYSVIMCKPCTTRFDNTIINVIPIKQIWIWKGEGNLTCLWSDSGDRVQVGLDVSLFKLHGEFKGRLGQNIESVWVSSSLHQLLSHSHLRKHTQLYLSAAANVLNKHTCIRRRMRFKWHMLENATPKLHPHYPTCIICPSCLSIQPSIHWPTPSH